MRKSILIILGFLLRHTLTYGQNTDTVQPDSLYRKYKVHYRSSYSEGSASQSREIFVFDQTGRYAGFILTDNETGKTPRLKITFQYNEDGILSGESDTTFRSTQYAVKKLSFCMDQMANWLKKC